MAPTIEPVQTALDFPDQTAVVVIGGGIIGLAAALNLAERDIPVVVFEKGRIAAEQSSRNLGWIRKLSRSRPDVPLALESQRLWAELAQRTGKDVGYRQAGIMFIARTEAEMDGYRKWLESVADLSLDARPLTGEDVSRLVPGAREKWIGGIFSPSDGYAEPTLASSAIAAAAQRKGAVIVENCAVRTLALSGGGVGGVVTERGEVRCDQALLAGGFWSRRFLGNLDVNLPTLPVTGSVLRTAPMEGPTDAAVGASNFSFRKRQDGGYTVIQRGAFGVPLTLDHLLIGRRYLPTLKANPGGARLSFGRFFFEDLKLARRWKAGRTSPFERERTMNPSADPGLVREAMRNLASAWPVFENAVVEETWAGVIDITPDSEPVISPVAKIPGLTLAAGFSGHGFGTSLAAGQLAAQLVIDETPIVDPTPYRLARFSSEP